MAFRVEISPQAFGDLDNISAYIRQRGSFESAERWFNRIMAAIGTLRDAPQRCPLAEESQRLQAQVRLLLSVSFMCGTGHGNPPTPANLTI